tara:strand:+ start:378 stop:722 length:345 start_codon:yes stop_codon:yes gene_type:complete
LPKLTYSIRLTKKLLALCRRSPDISTSHIRVYIVENDLTHARLGVKISKNAIQLAVVRNMVRRRLSAEFRNTSIMKPLDIIIIISKKIYSEKNEISDILMQEWRQSLKSLKKFY